MNKTFVSAIAIAAVFVLQGCRDKLPTKYLVCTLGQERCVVTASFKDLKACEFFKELSSIYCDRESNPELIVCDKRKKSVKSTSLCKPNVSGNS